MTNTTTELDRATVRHAMATLYRIEAEGVSDAQKASMWARFEAAELATVKRLS